MAQRREQWPSHQKHRDRRISVVGTIGSGKTNLAREISNLLAIPHIELDSLHWEPNWVEASDSAFRDRVNHCLLGDSWVADGNYHRVRDIIWSRAHTVVWLDYPFRTIMSRLARRTLRRVLTRQRLWNDNQEGVRSVLGSDSVFLWAIKTYRGRRRDYPLLLGRSENTHLEVVHLRSPRDAREWLSSCDEMMTIRSNLTRLLPWILIAFHSGETRV